MSRGKINEYTVIITKTSKNESNSKFDSKFMVAEFIMGLWNWRKNSKDFFLKEEERINDALLTLKNADEISDDQFNQMKSKDGQPPRIYGLAKVHKDGIPVRPVLSMPGSPYHNIAGIVTKRLSIIPESNSQCGVQKIGNQLKDIKLDDDEVLVTFDSVSLYTNVPVLESIEEAAIDCTVEILRSLQWQRILSPNYWS